MCYLIAGKQLDHTQREPVCIRIPIYIVAINVKPPMPILKESPSIFERVIGINICNGNNRTSTAHTQGVSPLIFEFELRACENLNFKSLLLPNLHSPYSRSAGQDHNQRELVNIWILNLNFTVRDYQIQCIVLLFVRAHFPLQYCSSTLLRHKQKAI